MKLFICTGGKGTRLRSVTNDLIPKTMVPVDGKPVMHHLVDWAKSHGIKDFIFMNGHLHQQIIDYFGNGSKFGVNITHSNEPYPLGSGGPLRHAAKYIDGTFIYISGDLVCDIDLSKMIAFHKEHNADITALVHKSSHPWDSDILQLDENSRVTKFVSKHDNHTEAGDLSNASLEIIEPTVIPLMDKEVFTLETYLYPKILQEKMKFMAYHTEEFIADMGTPERLKKGEDYILSKKKKEKILVTGAGGMMGQHLLPLLKKKGNYDILGTYYQPTTDLNELPQDIKLEKLDVRDYRAVHRIIKEFRPDKILHLAAQSYPTLSWKEPQMTMDVNVNGTINIFEAAKAEQLKPIILVACSSAEYGFVNPEDVPIKENRELLPLHPYGVSKVGQDLLSYQYFKNDGFHTLRARIFNTTGPKKVNDVCSDFTRQAALIELGLQEAKFRCGNLDTRRAITDVRDMIAGFLLLMEKGHAGEVYNISGEKAYLVRDIMEMCFKISNINPEVWQDPALMRPTDEKIIYGDNTRIKSHTGWQQQIPIEQTLRDMIDYWKTKYKSTTQRSRAPGY